MRTACFIGIHLSINTDLTLCLTCEMGALTRSCMFQSSLHSLLTGAEEIDTEPFTEIGYSC